MVARLEVDMRRIAALLAVIAGLSPCWLRAQSVVHEGRRGPGESAASMLRRGVGGVERQHEIRSIPVTLAALPLSILYIPGPRGTLCRSREGPHRCSA